MLCPIATRVGGGRLYKFCRAPLWYRDGEVSRGESRVNRKRGSGFEKREKTIRDKDSTQSRE
jgi:hypothetical protein